MRQRAAAPFVVFLALAVATPAAAQSEPSVDVRGFRASADPGAGLYLEPASSPRTGDLSAALWMSYAFRPITLEDPATEEVRYAVLGHQLSADLAASVGLAERVAIGLDMPLVLYQGGDEPTDESRRVLGDAALPAQSLGDLGISAKLTAVKPTRGEFGGFALALHQRVTVPTGSEASYVGEGAVTSETRLLGEYRLVALGLHFATGVKLRGEEARVACADRPGGDEGCPTRFGHELPFGLGLTLKPQAFGVDPEGRITLHLETHGYLPLAPIAPFESSRVAAAQVGAGVRYALRDVSFFGGVETALAGGVGNPPLRVMASVAYAPRVRDADGDGVPDERDACRELAEDVDRFQDDDGCPEGDNDEDGVVDEEDRCPDSKEDEDGIEDEDGCLDPDNDGDGLPDEADACPDEAGVDAGGPEQRGCPIRDTDGDGIQNEADRCPDEPEDRDGFQEEDGCPDPDNDADGILDAADACPAVKGDAKEKGCPDPDPDRDTILGPADRCPDAPEAWNGADDGDGCPEEDPQKKLKPLVVVKEAAAGPTVELSAAPAFTAEGAVDPASAPLLAALASEIARRPGWTARVGVRPSARAGGEEGATRRAEAVVAELRRLARRQDAAEAVGWREVQGAPRAAAHGVGVTIKAAQVPQVAK